MNRICFHASAEAEMKAAALWYEEQQTELGKRFLSSVEDALSRIRLNPRLFPVVESDAQRCLTHTFPYGVVFKQIPDGIVIIAVMHLRQSPDYWKDRA